MTESQVQIEYEFVTSLLADPTQLLAVDYIQSSMLEDSTLRTVYEVVRKTNGKLTHSTLLADLSQTPQGRMALGILAGGMGLTAHQDAIESLFEDGLKAGAAEILAAHIYNQAVVRMVSRVVAETKPDRFTDKSEFALTLGNKLIDIAGQSRTTSGNALLEGLQEEREYWQRMQTATDQIDGWRVNLGDYDKLMGGLQPGELILMGGHSGEGKSHVLCHMAIEAAMTQHDVQKRAPVVSYFSLEMSKRQITGRLVKHILGFNHHRKDLTPEQKASIDGGYDALADLGKRKQFILVQPHEAHNLEQIARTLIYQKQHHNLDMAFVDYAQLIKVSNHTGSKYEALAEISQTLKNLALQLELVVVMGVQLNRAALTESYAGRPRIHHVADSMDLVRSADAVHMIWTPAKYLLGEKVAYWQNIGVILTEKRRSGQALLPQYYTADYSCSRLRPVDEAIKQQLESKQAQQAIRKKEDS